MTFKFDELAGKRWYPYLSIFSPNAGKYGPEKHFRIDGN